MAIDAERFVERLLVEVPEAGHLVAEHLADNEEVLLHLLMGDLVRLCDSAWDAAEQGVLRRCLALLDDALDQGDEYVSNAIAVSFVEDSCWYEPSKGDYFAIWPEHLHAEVETQRAEWAKRSGDS